MSGIEGILPFGRFEYNYNNASETWKHSPCAAMRMCLNYKVLKCCNCVLGATPLVGDTLHEKYQHAIDEITIFVVMGNPDVE